MIQKKMSIRNPNRMANNLDPNEMARYEPSHLDLHCLHLFLVWSTELKGLGWSI